MYAVEHIGIDRKGVVAAHDRLFRADRFKTFYPFFAEESLIRYRGALFDICRQPYYSFNQEK